MRRDQNGPARALCQGTGEIEPGAMIGNEYRQTGEIGQAVGMLVEQVTGDGVRQCRTAQGFQARQRSRYWRLSLTPAHSSASGSASFFSMMTFHTLARSALSAM